MKRRTFLITGASLAVVAAVPAVTWQLNKVVVEDGDIETLDLSEKQWRERLNEDEFYVLREGGTEYHCATAITV